MQEKQTRKTEKSTQETLQFKVEASPMSVVPSRPHQKPGSFKSPRSIKVLQQSSDKFQPSKSKIYQTSRVLKSSNRYRFFALPNLIEVS